MSSIGFTTFRVLTAVVTAGALTSCRDTAAPHEAVPPRAPMFAVASGTPQAPLFTLGSGIGVGAYGRSTVGPFKIRSDYNGFKMSAVSREPADVEVVQLTIAPGGTTGWHAHPAPVFVIVTAGELTVYEADEVPCKPRVYRAGTGFAETGGSVHVARNDGSIPASLIATSLAPVGAATVIDAPQPNHCPF